MRSSGRWSALVAGADGELARHDGTSGPDREIYVARVHSGARAEVVLYDSASGAWSLVSSDESGSVVTTDGGWQPGMFVHAGRLTTSAREDLLPLQPRVGRLDRRDQ